MPKEIFGSDFAFLPKSTLLSNEEIVRLATVFAQLGVRKIRLTGGESLLRPHLPELVGQLASISGIEDISLTTNGSLLTLDKAKQLQQSGLQRINISLDALHNDTFQRLNDVHFQVEAVLAAIAAASEAHLDPVKVNMVVIKGINDQEIVDIAGHFRGTGVTVRFIEYMDVGNSNGWHMDQVFAAKDIFTIIHSKWPLQAATPLRFGDVATRYVYQDGQGEIGIISSITQPFCQSCTRVRLSADGQLFKCLFAAEGVDLRHLLRNGAPDETITDKIASVWSGRDDRYSELRSTQTTQKTKVEMSHIGG